MPWRSIRCDRRPQTRAFAYNGVMSEGAANPEETYTFTAKVAERWPDALQIVPHDWEAFVAFIERAGITTDIHWHPGNYVSVGVREFVARAGNAERVRYSIRAKATRRGREIEAVDLQPI